MKTFSVMFCIVMIFMLQMNFHLAIKQNNNEAILNHNVLNAGGNSEQKLEEKENPNNNLFLGEKTDKEKIETPQTPPVASSNIPGEIKDSNASPSQSQPQPTSTIPSDVGPSPSSNAPVEEKKEEQTKSPNAENKSKNKDEEEDYVWNYEENTNNEEEQSEDEETPSGNPNLLGSNPNNSSNISDICKEFEALSIALSTFTAETQSFKEILLKHINLLKLWQSEAKTDSDIESFKLKAENILDGYFSKVKDLDEVIKKIRHQLEEYDDTNCSNNARVFDNSNSNSPSVPTTGEHSQQDVVELIQIVLKAYKDFGLTPPVDSVNLIQTKIRSGKK